MAEAQKEKRNPFIISEDEVPASWTPVEAEPINPNESAAAPSPSFGSLPLYFRGTLAPNLQHDSQLVATDKNPRVASMPLMPTAPSANPQNNAGFQSIVKNTISSSSTPDIDPYLFFRGSWQSFITYNINDVVVQNLSTYAATKANVGLRPDQNSGSWTIIGENLVFNPATVPLSQGSGVGAFDGQILNTSVSPGGTLPIVGPLTPLAVNDLAFLAISQRETDLDSTWIRLYTSGATVAVALKALPTAGTLSATLTTTGFPWGANLLLFRGAGNNFSTLTGSITSVQVVSNVVTCLCGNSFIAGTQVIVSGLAGANFLNGTQAQIISATATQFTFAFTHADYGPSADSGTATWLPYYQSVQASFPGTNNSQTTNHLTFSNPVKAGSVLVFVGITGDNNANANLASISDTTGNSWVSFGDGHFGCAASVGYCQSAVGGTTNMACTGVWSTPSDVGMAFEFPGGFLQGWEPYDVVEFRGSIFVCLSETFSDAFAAPSKWALIGPATGFVKVKTTNYTAVQNDEGNLLSFNSSSAATLTLPNPLPIVGVLTDSGWWIAIENIGTGPLTVSPNGATLDGGGSLILFQNQGCLVFTDGSNFFTVRAASSGSGFSGGVNSQTTNYTAVFGDGGKLISMNGSSLTLTLPNPSPNNIWFIWIENLNVTNLTVARNGLNIDGAASNLTLGQNQNIGIFTDGTNYFTVHGMNRLTVPSWLSATAPDSSGNVAITTPNQTANQVLASPAFDGSGPLTVRPLVGADMPPLADASSIGTLITGNRSGNLRLPGNVIPPAGVYRVSTNFFLQFNPSAGSLAVSFGYNDGTAARTDSPASMDTSALNLEEHDVVVVSDGVHDISWTMTLV